MRYIFYIITFLLCFHTNIYANKPYDSLAVESRVELASKSRSQLEDLTNQLNVLVAQEEYKDSSRVLAYADKAHALAQKVIAEGRLVDLIDLGKSYSLPMGLNKHIGGIDYLIVFDSIMFTPLGGLITSYMSLDIPQTPEKLAFRGINKFTKSGITSGAKLELVKDYPIQLGSKMQMTLQAYPRRSFVSFDCNGYKSLNVDAELEFSRTMLLPEAEDGTILPYPAAVKTSFELSMMQWGEIIAKINIPSFQLPLLPGFGFQATDAYFDFNELMQVSGINYPLSYASPELLKPSDPMWEGVYIRNISVKLPKQFNQSGTNRTSFFAKDLIVDKEGLTGRIGVKGILPLDKGSMDGWRFSIDSLYLAIFMNQIEGGGLMGTLELPVLGNNPVRYKAIMDNAANYFFSAEFGGAKKWNLWAGDIEITDGSRLEVKLSDGRFLPKISLNGNLSINLVEDALNIKGIQFQELQFQTIKPYLAVGAFSVSSSKDTQRASGFPLVIKKIGIARNNDEYGLAVGAALNFVGENDGGFSADAAFSVWGEFRKEQSGFLIRYKRTVFDEVKIDVEGSGFKLKGLLAFYRQHQVYGKGFKGQIEASFKPGLSVQALAQFGNVNGYRYWYADALLTVPQGIPIMPGVALYGFGGGAYYHMKQKIDMKALSLPANETKNPSIDTSQVGKSVSGVQYIPDQAIALGIKAKVVIGTHPTPDPLNGDVAFEVAFNNNGGINNIGFEGNAYMLSPLGAGNKNAPMYANMNINYDFSNSTLFGNLSVFLNVAGGLVKGVQPNNKAGEATIYFAPEDWYLYIGTPQNRIGVSVLSTFNLSAYMMAGTIIPDMPSPPANVSTILGNLSNSREELTLRKGGGFAFGADLSFDTKDLVFLVFYARFNGGVGFDMMLKNYGIATRCEGRNEPIGINGWYASGQAYAYLQGKIGIKVNLTFVKGTFDIINVGAAAILQAKLPNPFWMQGNVGGHFSILGGLVSGKCNFQMTIGEQCKIEGGSAVSGIKMIAEYSPSKNEKKVSVFNQPQVSFNIPIHKNFELVDTDDQRKTFRAVLDYFQLTSNGESIKGKTQWNKTNDLVVFQSHDILPPLKTVRASAKVHFEELVGGNWNTIKVDGKLIEETAEFDFETGEAPDYIPQSNVLYSYPQKNQLFYLQKESSKGFIQLKSGQPYLFYPSQEWNTVGLVANQNQQIYFKPTYNTQNNQVVFDMPAQLNNRQAYTIQLLKIPKVTDQPIDKNLRTLTVNTSNDKNQELNVSTKYLEGNYNKLTQKELYKHTFKLSTFNTFTEKINSFKFSELWLWSVMTGINEVGSNMNGSEYFDYYDLHGSEHSKPLLKLEALNDNQWMEKHIIPLIYDNQALKKHNLNITWRNSDSLGIPPVRAVQVRQVGDFESVDEMEEYLFSNQNKINSAGLVYNLSYTTYKDYVELREKAAALYSKTKDADLEPIINSFYPILGKGRYNIVLSYQLPDYQTANSEKIITIK